MGNRLQGKAGLITASGSGMGRAGALLFAQEGASVAVVDSNAQAAAQVVDEIRAAGGHAIAIVGNLRDDDFAKDIIRQTVEAFGKIDFLWNHLGKPGPGKIEDIDMADFELAMDINLRSVFVTTTAALKEMRPRGKGAILYTSSVAGIIGSHNSPIYSAGKFAVIGMMKSLAKRVAKDGVRVNAISPGTVDTPMLRSFMALPDSTPTEGVDVEELVRKRAQVNPMGRAAQPAEIAAAALFMLSDDASFVTGANLAVDGGATA